MAIQIQYNKIALQQFEKALKIRLAALPTIRSKESALRLEVKKQKKEWNELNAKLKKEIEKAAVFGGLWAEWKKGLLAVNEVHTEKASLAGVNFRVLDYIDFHIGSFYIPSHPVWLIPGIEYMKGLTALSVSISLKEEQIAILEKERKRTTQKLNLYEKVQIPGYEEGIRKIKRFLEDQETLEKATQKIVKNKKQKALHGQ